MPNVELRLEALSPRPGGQRLGPYDLVSTSPCLIIVAPNGTGKSSLLGSMAGVTPHAGGWTVGGQRVGLDSLGFAPQHVSWPGSATVSDVCRTSALLRKIPRHRREEAVNDAIGAAGLDAVAHQRVGELSGGMTRRLTLAQAVVHRPTVALLDEPTSELDPGAAERFADLVLDLIEGCRVVVSTHRLDDVGQWPGDVVWLERSGARLLRVGVDVSEGAAKVEAVRELFRRREQL